MNELFIENRRTAKSQPSTVRSADVTLRHYPKGVDGSTYNELSIEVIDRNGVVRTKELVYIKFGHNQMNWSGTFEQLHDKIFPPKPKKEGVIIDNGNEFILGWTGFDESKPWRAFIENGKAGFWNGWARPYIFADDIKGFIEAWTVGEGTSSYASLDEETLALNVVDKESDLDETIEITMINNVKTYDLGSLGLVFHWYKTEAEGMPETNKPTE